MKRSRLVLGVLCLLVSTAAFASESWVLNIPLRFIANQETGEVRMIMDLDAAPPGSNSGPVKADILKSAVQGFVAQWEQIDAPVPGGKDDSPDRLGVVFFDSTAASQTLPGADAPANFFLQRGNAIAWDAVINKA